MVEKKIISNDAIVHSHFKLSSIADLIVQYKVPMDQEIQFYEKHTRHSDILIISKVNLKGQHAQKRLSLCSFE